MGEQEHDVGPRHGRLTTSPASASVTLIILRVADLAAALLDGFFEHPVVVRRYLELDALKTSYT